MEINITARHTDITDAMRDYAEKRARRLIEHFDTLSGLQVTLNVEKSRHLAEVIATCRRGGRIVATAETPDMYSTLDQVVDKMMNQLRKHKEKLKGHRVHKPEGTEPIEAGPMPQE